ncbi:transposase [Streptomyces sp. NPDC005827]|uniref:transposase n=1 Tax=Streptomyces sp. NPDC005827 TaxID=3157070 RepID=UPI0033E7822F
MSSCSAGSARQPATAGSGPTPDCPPRPWRPARSTASEGRALLLQREVSEDQHALVGVIPGWPYSWVVALESGRTSWVAPLDAVRLRPGDDLAAVTASQPRDLVERLIAARQWHPGDPAVWIVTDAGYESSRATAHRSLSYPPVVPDRASRVSVSAWRVWSDQGRWGPRWGSVRL